jgi:hypothetical protein
MRCFSSPGSPSAAMDSRRNNPKGLGFPIRRSTDQSLLAAPRGLSQRATSFIASWCQGIHQMPLKRLIYMFRHAQGQAPRVAVQTCNIKTRQRLEERPPDVPPIAGESAGPKAFVQQTYPRCQTAGTASAAERGRAIPAPARAAGAAIDRSFGIYPRRKASRPSRRSVAPLAGPFSAARGLPKALVEVTGIEPMTSCLQSRRSPN